MKNKKKNPLNTAFSAVLLVVFCAFLVGVMLWEAKAPEDTDPAQTVSTQPTGTTAPAQTLPPETVPTTAPVQTTAPAYEPRRINFLLVGRDEHGEGENGRSDSMILCSVDTGAKTVTMISFLRDIYLKIPDHGSSRLNSAYSWGGSELLIETMEQNFGIAVDVSLEIDFAGFESMIDYLGGVDIELTAREADFLNGSENRWALTEGVNHLDGEQALAYSRIRYLDSDFVRTERQRNVLTALLEKYQSASLTQMLHVTDEFLEQSTSDHSDEALLAYALELYTMLGEHEVITHRVPADGTYSYETIRGMSVVEIDLEENKALLAQLLGQD